MFKRYRIVIAMRGGKEHEMVARDILGALTHMMSGTSCLHAAFIHIQEERITFHGWRPTNLITLGPTKGDFEMAWLYMSRTHSKDLGKLGIATADDC